MEAVTIVLVAFLVAICRRRAYLAAAKQAGGNHDFGLCLVSDCG